MLLHSDVADKWNSVCENNNVITIKGCLFQEEGRVSLKSL